MLGIQMKLSTAFYSQTNSQTEHMNQELEQYLWLFVNYKQKNWPEWLAIAKFTINNQVHTITKVSPFMESYRRELWIGADIRRNVKIKTAIEFMERMRKVQEKAEAVLKKA